MDGAGRAKPRPGGPKQDVEGRRANPPLPKSPNSLSCNELGVSHLRMKIELHGIVLLSCFYFLEDCHAPRAKDFRYTPKGFQFFYEMEFILLNIPTYKQASRYPRIEVWEPPIEAKRKNLRKNTAKVS
jgi:hypothetical protein